MRALFFVAQAMLVMSACKPAAGDMAQHDGPILSGSSPDRGLGICELMSETAPAPESPRDCLNDLVKASLEDDDQAANLAFVKTHKTGSTSESALFVRYAQRHGLTWAQYDGQPRNGAPLAVTAPKILKTAGRVDVMHYHMTVGKVYAAPWKEIDRLYRTIMRDPDHINYVTILRQPREHLISYYYYFMERRFKVSIEDFLMHENPEGRKFQRLVNLSAKEFGIRAPNELARFFESALSTFKLVMLTERFDEGLCLLRRLMGWHLIDMTYAVSNETGVTLTPRISKDGKEVFKRPHFSDLPVEVQVKIDEMTVLDRAIYERGVAIWEQTLRPLATEVEEDVGLFKVLQRTVRDYLSQNPLSLAHRIYDVRHITEKDGFYPNATVTYNFELPSCESASNACVGISGRENQCRTVLESGKQISMHEPLNQACGGKAFWLEACFGA